MSTERAIQVETNVLGMPLASGCIRKDDDYIYHKSAPTVRICGVEGCLAPISGGVLPQEAFCLGHRYAVVRHLTELTTKLKKLEHSPQELNWERPLRDAKNLKKADTPMMSQKVGQRPSSSTDMVNLSEEKEGYTGVTMSSPVASIILI